MSNRNKPGEFELIGKYLAPLSAGFPGALLLTDDAAIIPTNPGHNLVVTTDMLISGVHFLEQTPPEYIASKAIRVNLSDLAAMGATPDSYTLSLALPSEDGSWNEDWMQRFCEALSVEQQMFDIALIGGDTVSTPGPLSISLTAFGFIEDGMEVTRSGARAGDLIFVSGTIGDAFLGLLSLKDEISDLPEAYAEILRSRHYRPSPRVGLGQRLSGLAHSAIDVSDGLVQDLGHLCKQSGVSALIEAQSIPLSDSARKVLSGSPDIFPLLLGGGDDYELLFTAPVENKVRIMAAAKELDIPMAVIGRIEKSGNTEVHVHDENGAEMPIDNGGYRHF